jgi:hypothetical protein
LKTRDFFTKIKDIFTVGITLLKALSEKEAERFACMRYMSTLEFLLEF